MENKIISEYFLSLFNDAILFSDDVEIVLQGIDYPKPEKYILSVIHKINEISERKDYPSSALINLQKLIEFLKQKYKDNKYIDLAQRKYSELLEISMSEEVYKYEAMIKFLDLDYALNDNLDINKKIIKQSIRFDYVTFYSLMFDSESVEENYLYIASLKKFFTEFPELFLDPKINENAKKILEINNKFDESKRLMYKLENIDKFRDNNFNYVRFKALMDYIYVENMLFNHDCYKANKKFVGEDKIASLYEIIKGDLLFNDKMRNNALEIMSDYKADSIDKMEDKLKKEKLIEYNSTLGRLNTMKYDPNSFIACECMDRLEGLDKVKALIKPLQMDDIEKMIQDDFLIILELASTEELRKNYKKAYISFNKFLRVVPDMFDNENIYNRAMKILKGKDIGTLKVKKKIERQFKR